MSEAIETLTGRNLHDVQDAWPAWSHFTSTLLHRPLGAKGIDAPSATTDGRGAQATLEPVTDLAHERTRRTIIALLRGPFCRTHPGDASAIDAASIRAASEFIAILPSDRALPRVGPDSDGDILMVWEGSLLLAFEKWRLHAVVNPATPQSVHISDVNFQGEAVPSEILRHIPSR